MQIDRSIRSGVKKTDDYIILLEEELLKKETSSIIKFITSANKVACALADDMELMLSGNLALCTILKDDKDSKLLDRLLNLLKSVDTFDQISKIADSLVPEVVEIKTETTAQTKLNPDENPFEQMQKRVKERINGQKG